MSEKSTASSRADIQLLKDIRAAWLDYRKEAATSDGHSRACMSSGYPLRECTCGMEQLEDALNRAVDGNDV